MLATADTDWLQILAIYELLARIADNLMIRLNQAIAAAMVQAAASYTAAAARVTNEADQNYLHRRSVAAQAAARGDASC